MELTNLKCSFPAIDISIDFTTAKSSINLEVDGSLHDAMKSNAIQIGILVGFWREERIYVTTPNSTKCCSSYSSTMVTKDGTYEHFCTKSTLR